MEQHVIKPDIAYRKVMFFVCGIVTLIGILPLTLFIIFIPAFTAKIIFGILFTVYLLLMLLYALWIPAFYKTLEYRIDSEAVKASKGVFWKKHTSVPYAKITNVDITEGPLQRMYGIGTVHVQTAGAGGAQGAVAELRLDGVTDYARLKEIVMAGVLGVSPRVTGDPTPINGGTDIMHQMLAELKAIRASLEQGRG
ncbi:PH domain-containing protein [Candidatus Omnitrophota bacterium]